ncbi:hypothetical protein [Candidatus Uabimicrobium sp. HlEnr_7]|uniref:hypothetical protein n=1 Tax=Candidatus Uabimicrobium helgolandensis TaxID=3095367 RepID=UPI003556740B
MIKYLFVVVFLVSCANDRVFEPGPGQEIPSSDPVWIESGAKGSSQKLAINKAWRNAMKEFVKTNMSRDLYRRNIGKIESYIIENWRSYTLGDPQTPQIIKRYHNRKIRIRAHIRGEIIYDIQRELH